MNRTSGRDFPALVRSLINDSLDDDTIRNLCFDHYRPVYNELSPAMSRTECIRRLVHWCLENRAFDRLLTHTQELNKTAFAEYATKLHVVPDNERYAAQDVTLEAVTMLPCVVHPLPPAPYFIGREREIRAINSFWEKSQPGTLSVLGLGGAGKTAIVSQFLDRLLNDGARQPAGLFVWSFYVNQDANAFLEAAYHYFSCGRIVHGSGTGTFYLLIESLNRLPRSLIVLDGLELVQRPKSDMSGLFGEITDPLLTQIIARLAAGLGHTKCLITTRFPLPRLDPWLGKTFTVVDVDQLELADARLLLRRHHIKGDDAALDELIVEYGKHALTLDHLGGYLNEYADSDAAKARELPQPELDSIDPQERRLARVLHAYDKTLSPVEHALLARLCIFRFGSTIEQLHGVFASSNTEIAGPLNGLSIRDFNKILKHLLRLHLALESRCGEFTAHPAVRDHFYRSFADSRIIHRAIQRYYSSLIDKPGTHLPTTSDTIDLLEELVYHTLKAGTIDKAREIYATRLGSYQHLAWGLGQYSRCIRVLTEFPQCPDPGGLVWCYRAVGDLKAAEMAVDPDDVWWLSMIGSLRGHLHTVSKILQGSRQDPLLTVAEFLTGKATFDTLDRAPIWPGLPITPAECYLVADQVHAAESFVDRALNELEHAAQGAIWSDEVARFDLIKAEIERRKGNLSGCRAMLEKATQWIVQSGSQEHLCALHLGKARLAIDEQEHDLAITALKEGIHIAEQCGFGFYSVDLHIALSDVFIRTEAFSLALDAAIAARNGILRNTLKPPEQADVNFVDMLVIGADHPICQYIWGSSRAGFLEACALSKLGKQTKAKAILEIIGQVQMRIGDPQVVKTHALMASLK